MRDGLPLWLVAIGAVVLLAAAALGITLYWRALEASILSDARIAVVEVGPDAAALEAASRAADAARAATPTAAAAEVVLDEAAANRAIFHEWLADPERDARLTLEPNVMRLRLAQRVRGRWLNAELLLAPYAGVDREGSPGSGLAFKILSGKVGEISISSVSGEWVRVKIERQLAHDLRQNPRTAALFDSLLDARVTPAGLVLRFGR